MPPKSGSHEGNFAFLRFRVLRIQAPAACLGVHHPVAYVAKDRDVILNIHQF